LTTGKREYDLHNANVRLRLSKHAATCRRCRLLCFADMQFV